MDDIVAITLFRHGLTEANKRHAYLGWTDSPLCLSETETRLQSHEEYDLVFSSDLGRCLETANILFPSNRAVPIRQLREMNFGQWEGKTFANLKNEAVYQNWLKDPFLVKPPQGESFSEFSKRVNTGWELAITRVLEGGVKKAAIITHGGVIRYLLSQFARYPKEFWEWQVPHHHGYELVWHRESLRRRERCILLQEVPLMAKPNG
ncbi:histidine phosphatase family protein [Mesobacillus harenae]|uniref:histidine phosphatase family protein n=1 Tax=Mesobacillus harenae TaxID=2213203 RepID=UPI001581288A|nr:histidine phosphatase family protein [Mesobacillus harenae]